MALKKRQRLREQAQILRRERETREKVEWRRKRLRVFSQREKLGQEKTNLPRKGVILSSMRKHSESVGMASL